MKPFHHPPTHHSSLTSYYPPSLGHTGFVYVRIDKHKTPLQQPYEGPYRIISTSEKFFTLDVNGRTENISVDRLKTAYLATGRYPPQLNNQEEDVSTPSSSSPLPNKSPGITTTRSGRSVRRPPHIVKDYIAGIQESYNNAGGSHVATNQLARAKDSCDERRRCASMRENANNDFR